MEDKEDKEFKDFLIKEFLENQAWNELEELFEKELLKVDTYMRILQDYKE
jgi:hypothetical protein